MKRRLTVAGTSAAIAGLIVAGMATASWTNGAFGNGQAASIAGQVVTVERATAAQTLYPGVTNGTLVFLVTNPNPYPVQITTITAGSVSGIVANDNANVNLPSCAGSATGITYNWTSKTGLTHVVGANGGTFTYTLTGALSMSASSHATCAGAIFTVPVAVTAASAAGSPASSPNSATVAVP